MFSPCIHVDLHLNLSPQLLYSHFSSFIFRYCPRVLFSALTHSFKLGRPFPPSLRGKYSLSAFDLGRSAWYMFSTFLVFLSILWSSDYFQSTMPALYLISGTAHVFIFFTVFPELSFDFSIAFNLVIYSFLIIFNSWCFISSPSIIPKYLYSVSSMSLMQFPSGSCIPSVLVTSPLWMLTSAHFSIPNSILMSPEKNSYCLNQCIYLFGTSPEQLDVIQEHKVVNSVASFLELVPDLHSL